MTQTSRAGLKRLFFASPADRRGRVILAWGVVAFAITPVVLYLVYEIFPLAGTGRGLITWLLTPLFLVIVPAMVAPMIFVVGFATGIPAVSFGAGIAWMKKVWRGIVGALLLVSAGAALLNEFAF